MKNIKKILIGFIFISVIWGNPSQSKAGEYKMSDAKNGVVRIYAEVDSETAYTGTGFAVGNVGGQAQYFVTNNHVVTGAEDNVYVIFDNIQGTYMKATVIFTSAAPDIAILDIKTPTDLRSPVPLLASEFVEAAEDVYAFGFPGSADEINDDSNNLPSTVDDITITKGIISKLSFNFEGTACYQTDTEINSGNSGGPLVTDDGYVIGINTFGSTTGSAINGSIHIDYIIAKLTELGIPFTNETKRGSTEEVVATPEPAATPEPTAVTTDVPTAEPDEEPTEESAEEASSDIASDSVAGVVGVLIILAIFVLIGVSSVVIIVVLVSKSNQKKKIQPQPFRPVPPNRIPTNAGWRPQQTPPPYVPPMQQPLQAPLAQQPVASAVKQVSLMAMSGIYAGNSFSLTGPLAIGRDPKHCKIIYPSETQGISGLHCEIKIEDGKLILMDKGSTFGTFLSDGTQLIPNKAYPVKLGDSFYLADKKNEFKLINK